MIGASISSTLGLLFWLATFILVGGTRLSMLYTVLMEYRGGTYVSQVRARTVVAALQNWASELNPTPIQAFSDGRKRELIREIESGLRSGTAPAPLNGLHNVWCTSAALSGGMVLINIVRTDR